MSPSPPFALKGLDHIVLNVADLRQAQAFYETVLGATFERSLLPDFPLVQLRAGTALIDLVPQAAQARGPGNMNHFCLRLDPWDEPQLRAHLAGHGVEIHEEGIRYGAEGNGPSLYIRDPDGNEVELKGPPLEKQG